MNKDIEVKIYENMDLPDHLKWQILSFLRIQWPDGFMGKNQFRDWISKLEYHPVHLVLVKNNILVSYVCIVWKNLNHQGKTYKTYGLSGVFTYPAFRNQGYGLKAVKEAKKYLEKQDGDIVLFTSIHQDFYEKAGFKLMVNSKVLVGDPQSPKEEKEYVFMDFLSEKGKAGKNDFEEKPIYFGEEIW